MKTHFDEKTTYRGDKCYMSKCQKNVSPKWYPCRGDQSCAAETTKTPPTYPKYFADVSKDFSDASKIFCQRVQGFRRRVKNILPTRPRISLMRPKYFAHASKDFADASGDFTADVVTLPTRPVTKWSTGTLATFLKQLKTYLFRLY